MVAFPTSLQLEQREIDAVNAWFNSLTRKLPDDFEECVPSSSVTFHVYATGLGDCKSAHVWDAEQKLTEIFSFSIGDDNELYTEEYVDIGQGWQKKHK